MQKLISLVVPAYNEEKNIKPLLAEIKAVFAGLSNYTYEIIFINDGSTDKTLLELNQLAQQDKKIKIIDFSRNFGKEIATSAGCHFSSGDAVITMDADLQHPPKLIPELIKKWEDGFDVVYTVRTENKGAGIFKRLTSYIYWRLFNKISSINSEPHSTDFRIIDKKVVENFRKFPERGRLFRGIVDWMGYKRTRLEFVAPERNGGRATYSYKKLFHLAINSITAFSLLPLRLAAYFGTIITSFSFIFLIIMSITRWFINPTIFSPIGFVIVANTLLMGIVLVCLGFIALYIARIHDEVVGRPLYIIRNKINLDNE